MNGMIEKYIKANFYFKESEITTLKISEEMQIRIILRVLLLRSVRSLVEVDKKLESVAGEFFFLLKKGLMFVLLMIVVFG